LGKMRLKSAYVLAMILDKSGQRHPDIAFALAAGGIVCNQPAYEARGTLLLSEQVDALTAAERHAIRDTASQLGMHFTKMFLGAPNGVDSMLRVIEILKAAEPQFRAEFDWDAPIPELTGEEMRRRGREKSRLTSYPLPPADAPRLPRRVLVADREFFAPHQVGTPGTPWPRLMMSGPALVDAMNGYGWQAEFFPMFGPQLPRWQDYIPAMLERCRQMKPDILVLESGILFQPWLRPLCIAMLRRLRQEQPEMKLVANMHDIWDEHDAEMVLDVAPHLDLLWQSCRPSMSFWQHPSLANKLLHTFCVPNEWCAGTTDRPLAPHISFLMSVQVYNWQRAMWLTAIQHKGIPIQVTLSNHREADGMSASESHLHWMRRLEESTCCLSLLRRAQNSFGKMVVWRSFETFFSGALLVQESTPDMDYHFVAGEHYLEFSSVAELAAVARFIAEHREEAEEIRRRGHAFARERYGDRQLIGYLDYQLYFAHNKG
ncbi:MAG: glycosyltransferase, partial [Magnetococcales bacterium]|nr:glycosyltransferase [Magnetococcales bacterium]